MLEEGFFDPLKPLHIRWGDLPHWRQDCALYFVTFRLSDSLPEVLLQEWKREQEEWRRANGGAGHEMLIRRSIEQQRRVERWLDRGRGSCVLRDERAKRIVADTLRHFDGVRYELGDVTVAPNHVHALLRTALGIDLSDVLYSWKRFSSREILKIKGMRKALSGYRSLWQKECFDHIVRNVAGLERIRRYIRNHGER